MDELLLVDDIGALIEKAEDNMDTLDSLIESCNAQIQELFDKEQELIAEGASEVAIECWYANEATKNEYFDHGIIKTLMKAADKWYTSNTIGNLQRVVEDENNVRIIKANAEMKYSKRFVVNTLYGKPLFDHINLFTSFIATPFKNIVGQFQHFFSAGCLQQQHDANYKVVSYLIELLKITPLVKMKLDKHLLLPILMK